MNPHSIPQSTRDALLRYVQEGLSPGTFLRCVLSNDLRGAVSHGDEDNLKTLPTLMMYIWANLPSASWGSRETVEKWSKIQRQERNALHKELDHDERFLYHAVD